MRVYCCGELEQIPYKVTPKMGANMETIEQLQKRLNGAIQMLQLAKDKPEATSKKRTTRGFEKDTCHI